MSNANNSKFDPFCSKKHQCKDCDNRCVNQIAFLKDLPMEFQNALMLKAEYKKFKRMHIYFMRAILSTQSLL